jgi:hypothetical protein
MLKKIMMYLVLLVVLIAPFSARAGFESEAPLAVLMDYDTGAD